MSGVGGYVRRKDRIQGEILHLRQRGDGWPFTLPVTWQSMPLLRFEPFDVVTEDDTKTVDQAVMDVVHSFYDKQPR